MHDATGTQKQQLMQLFVELGELLADCRINGESCGDGCDGGLDIMDTLHELEEKCDYYID
jgi:hypothetical protein